MSLNTLKRGPPPLDMITAYQVLDGMTGTRAATLDLLLDRSWPGDTLVVQRRTPADASDLIVRTRAY